MPFLVARLLKVVRTVRGWRLALAVVLFVFGTSWLALSLVEPASNEMTRPENFWWWFLVTSSTVGYGDFFPQTAGGHVVGAYVIIGGIVALTIVFTELASYLQNARSKRMKGSVAIDTHDHVVVLGYAPGRTERIVGELVADRHQDIVLCAWDDVADHPMANRPEVRFVRGDLTSIDVLDRASVRRASTVVIDGRDDNETLTITVAVDHVNPRAHVVAALRDMDRAVHLRYVNPGVQAVQWHLPNMVSEEALDPGITEVYAELMSSAGSGNTYSARLPSTLSERTFGHCQTHFGQRYGATVVAVRQGERLLLSPAWDTELDPDALIYYVADRRITP